MKFINLSNLLNDSLVWAAENCTANGQTDAIPKSTFWRPQKGYFCIDVLLTT